MYLETFHSWSHSHHSLLFSDEVQFFDSLLEHICVYFFRQITPVLWSLELKFFVYCGRIKLALPLACISTNPLEPIIL